MNRIDCNDNVYCNNNTNNNDLCVCVAVRVD